MLIACGKDDMNPTSNDLNATTSMATAPASTVSSASQGPEHHVKADLVPVGGSGVSGHVNIEALPHGGVNISIEASGLTPGVEYLSLYYENHTCEIEPYEEDDIIGTYTGNSAGIGQTQNKLEDDLDEVNSISVRLASDFSLLACADIHP